MNDHYVFGATHEVVEADGTRRPKTDEDACLIVNEDGTVTIPEDVEVFEGPRDDLWFRTPRLQGWAGEHRDSPLMTSSGDKTGQTLGEAVEVELARQGRTFAEGLPPDYRWE
jgi:hypothetical protein